jgi:hypothetical protein
MWRQLTVGKFQQLYDIITGQDYVHEIERQIQLLACLDGKPASFYEGLPLVVLQEECQRTAFLFADEIKASPVKYIKADGREFKVMYNASEPATGMDMETFSFVKIDIIQHMHNILAAICVPVERTWYGRRKMLPYGSIPHYKVAEMMLKAPVSSAHAAVLFFYQIRKNSITN